MATRFYITSSSSVSGLPATSPNVDAAWQESAALVRRRAITKSDVSAATSVTCTSTATNPELHVIAQAISDPLEAQTVSGTITGQIRALESNASFNGTIAIGLRVISDAGTVRGTLYAVAGNANAGAGTPPEFATSLTNRQLTGASSSTPLGLTNVTAVAGDRIVIELGIRDADAGTSRTGALNIGAPTASTDLAVDNTTTTANNPWVEFSQTLVFMALRPPSFDDGVGWQRVTDIIESGAKPKVQTNS